jgi:esterase/lipase
MSATIVFNTKELQQISQSKEIRYLELFLLARKLNRAAVIVKKQWHKLSDEERENLKKLAYNLTESRSGLGSVISKFLTLIRIAIIVTNGQADALIAYCKAMNSLVDNIFEAVEKDKPEYQAVLLESLQQLTSDSASSGKVLKPGETRGWLRNLSDQALNEI